MEVESEGRCAVRHAVHQRRRARWVHRRGRFVLTNPDGAGGQQVGQVQCVEQRAAHVFHAVARQAAHERVHCVERLDAGGKSQGVDGFLNLKSRFLQSRSVFVHHHHHTGVVPLSDLAAVDLGNGGFRVMHH